MYLDLGGVCTYVERTGAGEPLVLIHPLGGSTRSWVPVRECLGGRVDAVAYDWAGHGRSEKSVAGYTPAGVAGVLALLIEEIWDQPASLVGVAYGAAIALETAARRPELVSRLVLASAFARADTRVRDAVEQRARDVETNGMRVAIESSVRSSFSPGFLAQSPEAVTEYSWEFLSNDPRNYANAARLVHGFDVEPCLPRIQAPCLLVVGDADGYFPPHVTAAVRERLPNATMSVVPEAGHFLNLERPDLFAQLIDGHVNASRAPQPVQET